MNISGGIMFVAIAVILALVVLITLGLTLAKLYRRASKSIAFVRTGAGGAKVIKDGGALVFPILHEIVQVNMNTLKLEISRKDNDALITFDRMRVDVGVEFYVRVKQDETAIATAAQTLGDKTLRPVDLKGLVEGKFVDALRSVASSMTMKDLHEQRADFVQKVQTTLMSDLAKNGLELESVSLTSFNQTKKEFFNVDNAFDAEGLTLLTQEIEQRKKIRNDIEKDNQLLIAQKNLATEKEQLLVNQSLEKSRAETNQQISFQKATQAAEVAKFEAERIREAETARIEAEKVTQQARIAKDKEIKAAEIDIERSLQEKSIEKDRALKEATISQQRQVEIAEQDKRIVIAKKSEEEAAARASAEKARAVQVQASQDVMTIEQVAEAERRQRIEVINAEAQARKDSVKIVVAAQAEAEAADKRAEATLKVAGAESEAEIIRAKGIKAKYDAEAEGQSKINEAANKQSAENMRYNLHLKLVDNLPAIIRESVKPMEKIESIRIVDMGNTNLNGVAGSGTHEDSQGQASLPDQVVNASLRHRAAAPLVDSLLDSVGIQHNNVIGSLTDTLGLGKNNAKDAKNGKAG